MKLSVEKLSLAFRERVIISELDFTIDEDEIVAILGRNGSGKTVTLKSISGLIKPSRGEIRLFHGDELLASSAEELRAKTAFVFQKGGLFDSMDILNNVTFGLIRQGWNLEEALDKGRDALERVGLKGNENKLPSQLSGGMQKRVGLARAISLGRDFMVMDDPTAGLDPVLTDSMGDLIVESQRRNNSLCIVSTHDMRLVKRIAGKVILLYDGEIVFCGSRDCFFSGEDPWANQYIQGALSGPMDIN